MSAIRALEVPAHAADAQRSMLQARMPEAPRATLSWFPGMGIAARHFLAFADPAQARAAHAPLTG